jgi:hypothetical protein
MSQEDVERGSRSCFCLGGAVIDVSPIQSSRCPDSRKAGANRCWFESGLRAAAHGGLGIGEGVCMLAEFLDVDDLAVLD